MVSNYRSSAIVQPEGNLLNQASYPVAPGLTWSIPLVGRPLNTWLVPRVGAVVLRDDIEVSEEQLLNVQSPIEVTPSGMLIEASEEQPLNI